MKIDSCIELGEVLRVYREKKGWKIEYTASLGEISIGTISKIENGDPTVSTKKIDQLKVILGISKEEIRSLKDDRADIELLLDSINSLIETFEIEPALKELEQLKTGFFPGYINFLKGKCYLEKGQEKNAEEAFHEVIKNKYKDKSNLISMCYHEIGRCLYKKNNVREALIWHKNASDSFDPEGAFQYFQPSMDINEAIYLKKMGFRGGSLKIVNSLWSIRNEIKKLNSLLNLYELYAEFAVEDTNLDLAEEVVREGIELARINSNQNRLADFWTKLGVIKTQLKRFNSAQMCFGTTLKLKERITEPRILITTYEQMGVLYMEQANLNKADECFNEAVRLANDLNDHIQLVGTLHLTGDLKKMQGQHTESLKLYKEAAQISHKYGLNRQEYESIIKLAEHSQIADNTQEYKQLGKRIMDLELEYRSSLKEDTYEEV
ncbi:helix-turn-helix domain-containing protein [Mechercharimyces sp. CAU 1602]|uniref:helix-turn-helix domain-containing protein n=1 Tax=Mechercharimyces sp. CAU 1602 TaxID=2973933 RepID=UPI002161ED1E|nr:tetratricopeptide repeat protein [Mechercharimyces sp. CAU 1602]MCS1351129.1 tetratricopeptide repeat protein [Mechercharimyces sp. CAU 1602]